MFADVVGSTELYEGLGNDAANRIIGKAVDLMGNITEANHGIIVKTIGDEIMSRFDSADDSVRAAREIQEELEYGLPGEDVVIAVRVGLHFGPAILQEDNDVFGDAVNIAYRMASIAKAEQIIITEETVRLLSDDLQESTRQFDKTTVKGKADAITIYQVTWENNDLTSIETVGDQVLDEVKYLVLQVDGKQIKIGSDEYRIFLMGRSKKCDLVVAARFASRSHAQIEFHRGKFVLSDQSSNGTFLSTGDGENIYLRRQEFILWGSGQISLGEKVSHAESGVIRYTCK